MAGMLWGQVGVFILHPCERIKNALVPTRLPARQLSHLFHPLGSALMDGRLFAICDHLWRGAKSFNDHEFFDSFGIKPRIAQSNCTAHGVSNDRDWVQLFLVNELSDVIDKVGEIIGAANHPLTVTMTA